MTAFTDSSGQAVISRFAPSPTGALHLGHAVSAIAAHDVARAAGGSFLLRIEDLDAGRSRAEHVAGIMEDLRWLGLSWDTEPVFQSARGALYADALDRLTAMGLTYPCVCTRAEIVDSAGAPQGDRPPAYPGTCRAHPPAPDDPRPACIRLDMAGAIAAAGPLDWHDADAGWQCLSPADWGDVVLARKGGEAAYHLAVVCDDAAQGVTDIVRGRDLFSATPIHVLLQHLLGLPTPRYHHHRLVVGPDGKRLAKRADSASLALLRANGMDGKALAAMIRHGELPIGFAFDAA